VSSLGREVERSTGIETGLSSLTSTEEGLTGRVECAVECGEESECLVGEDEVGSGAGDVSEDFNTWGGHVGRWQEEFEEWLWNPWCLYVGGRLSANESGSGKSRRNENHMIVSLVLVIDSVHSDPNVAQVSYSPLLVNSFTTLADTPSAIS